VPWLFGMHRPKRANLMQTDSARGGNFAGD
jgi:hypothetical protein